MSFASANEFGLPRVRTTVITERPTTSRGRTVASRGCTPPFTNPETRAYGADGLPEQPLYLVGFAAEDVRPDDRRRTEIGSSLDVFEHWLEDAE